MKYFILGIGILSMGVVTYNLSHNSKEVPPTLSKPSLSKRGGELSTPATLPAKNLPDRLREDLENTYLEASEIEKEVQLLSQRMQEVRQAVAALQGAEQRYDEGRSNDHEYQEERHKALDEFRRLTE